jgi:hypothetical protein
MKVTLLVLVATLLLVTNALRVDEIYDADEQDYDTYEKRSNKDYLYAQKFVNSWNFFNLNLTFNNL